MCVDPIERAAQKRLAKDNNADLSPYGLMTRSRTLSDWWSEDESGVEPDLVEKQQPSYTGQWWLQWWSPDHCGKKQEKPKQDQEWEQERHSDCAPRSRSTAGAAMESQAATSESVHVDMKVVQVDRFFVFSTGDEPEEPEVLESEAQLSDMATTLSLEDLPDMQSVDAMTDAPSYISTADSCDGGMLDMAAAHGLAARMAEDLPGDLARRQRALRFKVHVMSDDGLHSQDAEYLRRPSIRLELQGRCEGADAGASVSLACACDEGMLDMTASHGLVARTAEDLPGVFSRRQRALRDRVRVMSDDGLHSQDIEDLLSEQQATSPSDAGACAAEESHWMTNFWSVMTSELTFGLMRPQ